MPAPAPQATSSLRCPTESPAHCENRLAAAAPSSLGAASRPNDAPAPTTTSERTDVPRLRRNDNSAWPVQISSSTSVLPQCLNLRSSCLLYTSDAADEEDSVDLG